MRTPTEEAALYDSATVEEPFVETAGVVLPVSTLGMQARKRALREQRCIPAREAPTPGVDVPDAFVEDESTTLP